MKVFEVKNIDPFFELRHSWNKVLRESEDNTVFLTWEKMASSVLNFDENKTLNVLCATQNDKLVGIAPLRKSRRSINGLLKYTVIEPLAEGNTDYSGLVLAKHEAECLQFFLTHLFDQNDWDLMYLSQVPQNSHLFNLLAKHRCSLPEFTLEEGAICPYLTLPFSKQGLMKSLSSNFRRNLKKRMRKLEKDYGKVELKEYRELGSLDTTMQIFFDLHQKRWGSKGEKGTFKNLAVRDTFLTKAKLFAEKDWLRLYFLTVNDKPIAAKYCFKYKQKLYGSLSGFDPSYSSYGVGNVLMLKVLERCIDQGIREYDFMQGDELYKFDWTNKYRQNWNIIFVNKKPTSKLVRAITNGLKRIHLDKILDELPATLKEKLFCY